MPESPSIKDRYYASGVVRRIDEIGRIVIPSEIRRSMGWKTGDPIELYCDRQGSVILHKFSQLDGISGFGDLCIQQLHKQLGGVAVMLCDLEQVIAIAGLPLTALDKTPPRWLQNVLNNIKTHEEEDRIGVPLVTNDASLIGALGIISKDGIKPSFENALSLTGRIITEYATAS